MTLGKKLNWKELLFRVASIETVLFRLLMTKPPMPSIIASWEEGNVTGAFKLLAVAD